MSGSRNAFETWRVRLSHPGWVWLGWFVAALAVRMLELGHADLWCDEILFVNLSLPPRVSAPWQVFQTMYQQFMLLGHLPWPNMVQNVFLLLTAPWVTDQLHAPFLQRLPAVIWGSAAVPMFYLLALRLLPRLVAVGATAMVLLFFFPVYYSREAYYYAPLLFAVTTALYIYLRIAGAERIGVRWGWGMFLALLAVAYSHVSGAVLIFILLAVSVALLVRRLVAAGGPKNAGYAGWLIVIGVAVLLAVSPFYIQFLTRSSPLQFPKMMDYATIVNHGMGILFMGTHGWATILGWILLASGVVYGVLGREAVIERRSVLAVVLLGGAALVYSAQHSLYAPRYFTVISPCFYLLLALGCLGLARGVGLWWPGVRRAAEPLALGLMLALACVHMLFYLPSLYRLTAKSVNFGGIARWLHANLRPGSAYLLESAYDARFVSGYFATPELVAATPYAHRYGNPEMLRLREIHKAFLLENPDVYFVECAHHGANYGDPLGVWTWPHEFFKRKQVVDNPSYETLVRRGICLELDPAAQIRFQTTEIYYNTPDEARAALRREGGAAWFHFDGWVGAQIPQDAQRNLFFRAARGWSGEIAVEGLDAQPITGRLSFLGLLYAPAGEFVVAIKWNGQVVSHLKQKAGEAWAYESPELLLAPGTNRLECVVTEGPRSALQAILVGQARFVRRPGEQ